MYWNSIVADSLTLEIDNDETVRLEDALWIILEVSLMAQGYVRRDLAQAMIAWTDPRTRTQVGKENLNRALKQAVGYGKSESWRLQLWGTRVTVQLDGMSVTLMREECGYFLAVHLEDPDLQPFHLAELLERAWGYGIEFAVQDNEGIEFDPRQLREWLYDEAYRMLQEEEDEASNTMPDMELELYCDGFYYW